MTTAIERMILCTILENQFLLNNESIKHYPIESNIFTTKSRRKIANGIIYLKKQDEPIDAELLRMKAIKANKWDENDEHELTAIIANKPSGSYETLDKYYLILKRYYKQELDRRYAV